MGIMVHLLIASVVAVSAATAAFWFDPLDGRGSSVVERAVTGMLYIAFSAVFGLLWPGLIAGAILGIVALAAYAVTAPRKGQS
jgi:hypothetical protein